MKSCDGQYRLHGVMRLDRRGNWLRACCATGRIFRAHRRSGPTNSAFRLSIDHRTGGAAATQDQQANDDAPLSGSDSQIEKSTALVREAAPVRNGCNSTTDSRNQVSTDNPAFRASKSSRPPWDPQRKTEKEGRHPPVGHAAGGPHCQFAQTLTGRNSSGGKGNRSRSRRAGCVLSPTPPSSRRWCRRSGAAAPIARWCGAHPVHWLLKSGYPALLRSVYTISRIRRARRVRPSRCGFPPNAGKFQQHGPSCARPRHRPPRRSANDRDYGF